MLKLALFLKGLKGRKGNVLLEEDELFVMVELIVPFETIELAVLLEELELVEFVVFMELL